MWAKAFEQKKFVRDQQELISEAYDKMESRLCPFKNGNCTRNCVHFRGTTTDYNRVYDGEKYRLIVWGWHGHVGCKLWLNSPPKRKFPMGRK